MKLMSNNRLYYQSCSRHVVSTVGISCVLRTYILASGFLEDDSVGICCYQDSYHVVGILSFSSGSPHLITSSSSIDWNSPRFVEIFFACSLRSYRASPFSYINNLVRIFELICSRGDIIKRNYWHCVIMETSLRNELDLPSDGLSALEGQVGLPAFTAPFCEADHRGNQSSHFEAHYASQLALRRLCADMNNHLYTCKISNYFIVSLTKPTTSNHGFRHAFHQRRLQRTNRLQSPPTCIITCAMARHAASQSPMV